MLCTSHALNGNLRCGVKTDWTTHMIGHELTARFGIDHARTLAIIGPRLFEHQFERKKVKLAQYGRRVFGINGEDETVARQAIEQTERFFQSLGIETRLSAYSDETKDFPNEVSSLFKERNWVQMGEHKAITPEDVSEIVAASI
jgi:NADP-dependent alcohol dehydrogenase